MLKMLGFVVIYPSPSFGSVEQQLWSCSSLCQAALKHWSVWLEHTNTLHVSWAPVSSALLLALVVVPLWFELSPCCVSHQSVTSQLWCL